MLASPLDMLALRSNDQAARVVASIALATGSIHTRFGARRRLARVRSREAGAPGCFAEHAAVETDVAADGPALACEEV